MDTKNFDISKLSKEELVELIEYHNHIYWENADQEIPDYRYDELTTALEKIDPNHELLTRIYTPRSANPDAKVLHREPMLSLDKAYSLDEVDAWAKKYIRSQDEELLVEPKYDGISADYSYGILSTRGDGEYGEDITDKLPLIELESPGYTGHLDRPVRGELLIRDDDFKNLYSHIRRKNGGYYKNSRNAVAGIVGLKEIAEMKRQGAKLTLVDYNLVSHRIKYCELREKWEPLQHELAILPYPQDGIVIKLADIDYANSLGNTAHHPRGGIAFKFTNIRKETKLIGVEWSFGKNCLTPVAELEPVEISGTTIRHATLHNLQNLLELDVQIGDTVIVERAGDVIPYIVSSRPGAERLSPLIDKCPCCSTKLIQRGPEICCPNPECRETELQRLVAAVRSLRIERLGEPTLRKIMEKFGIKRLRELFNLTAMDLLKIDGFAEKSANNLVQQIQKARVAKDYDLLAALNIPNIGVNTAKEIFKHTDFNKLRQMTAENLGEIPSIGPERGKAIVAELTAQSEYLDELLEAISITHESAPNEDAPTVCFTGKMPEKRSYYENLAQINGYQPVDDVTASLSLLVASHPEHGGNKLQKATKFGIKIVALDEFLAMLELPNTTPKPPDKNEQVTLF